MPVHIHSPRGRPRQADLDRARKENERAEMEHMLRQESIAHQFEETLEKMRAKSGGVVPEEFAQMMQMLLSLSQMPFRPPYSGSSSLDDMTREFVRRRAADNPGVFVMGKENGVVEIYDFTSLLARIDQLNYYPEGDPDEPEGFRAKPYVELIRAGEYTILTGGAAKALMGFVHYQGVFLVEDAKRPCPDCASGSPRDCATCGGLRWIIPDAEPAPAALDRGNPRTMKLHGDCLHDPPIDEGHAPQFRNMSREQAGKAMGALFEAQLKAVSILQAIRRWCDSGQSANAGEALEAIAALVDEAIEASHD